MHMEKLIETRCKQGKLIITDQDIRVKLGPLRESTLPRSSLSSIDTAMAVPAIFGLGGGTNLLFHGQGAQVVRADLVKTTKARAILVLLGY
jgi:hypothetical protein